MTGPRSATSCCIRVLLWSGLEFVVCLVTQMVDIERCRIDQAWLMAVILRGTETIRLERILQLVDSSL